MPIIREFDFVGHRIRSPYLRLLFDYWEKLRRGRAAPDASDVDALDIPVTALPFVILVDLERDPVRARYRLVGTHSSTVAGWDYTGKYVHEIEMPNTRIDEIMEDFSYALDMKPMYAIYKWPLRDDRGVVDVEMIQLPLLENGVVTRCFCGEHVVLDDDLHFEDMSPIFRIPQSLTAGPHSDR